MQLVIDKYGCALTVKDGRFLVSHKEGKKEIPVMKVETIMINRSTRLSGEVVAIAVDRQIDIIFIERTGKPFARIWSPKFGSVSTIRKHQLAFSQSTNAISWVKEIIMKKADNQCAIMIALNKNDFSTERVINQAVEKIQRIKEKINATKANDLKSIAGRLRGLEGNASKIYFKCISDHLPEKFQFEKRTKRPAEDMFNALLNYAYGMMYHTIEGILIKSGIDPYIGIFHRDEYNRPVFVYDVIEAFRMWSEYVAINLCQQKVIFKEFFDIKNQGWYLNSNGKRILIQAFNDYMEEVVRIGNLNRSRKNHIVRFAEEFANYLKTFKSE